MEELARFGRASLAQVAELTGRSEEQVAEAAVRLEGEGAAVRGMLAASAVTPLIAGVEPARSLRDAEVLLRNAFRLARESAKADWDSMAVPVLKNRLLQLTDGTFREQDFGAPSIWHFVTLFPGLVVCEGARPSERVRLREPELIETDDRDDSAELDPVGKGRIRNDLWRAVFDYRSGKTYAWDEALGRASEHADSGSTSIRVPTITAPELRDLRREFTRTQETVSEHDAARLAEWVEGAGATAALPRFYRPLWNAHLKSHAADRLRTFFMQAGLDVPSDLIANASPTTSPVSEVEHARRRAHAYVDAMTAEELGRLSIELSVIARVRISDEG